MRLARRAVSEGQTVLKLDKSRKEAGLIVGTYRYIVSQIPAGLRWLAYIVGFEGGKDEGIRQIEEAARYSSDVQTDARFALVLLYNREKRYADAVTALRSLQKSYPRNRLLPLEEASTELRANRPAEALRVLDETMPRLAQDDRPRMPGRGSPLVPEAGHRPAATRHAGRGRGRLEGGPLREGNAQLGDCASPHRAWQGPRPARRPREGEVRVRDRAGAGEGGRRRSAIAEATRLLGKPYVK